jgi:ATP-dependent RNA helicase MRH4, mitochondrial
MLSPTTSTLCRACLLTRIPLRQSPCLINQIRFKTRIKPKFSIVAGSAFAGKIGLKDTEETLATLKSEEKNEVPAEKFKEEIRKKAENRAQAEVKEPETVSPDVVAAEIWQPNQKDTELRQSTFSHPSHDTIAQAKKQLRSSWAPKSFHDMNLIKGLPEAIEKVTLGHLNKAIEPTDIQALAVPIITKLDTAGYNSASPPRTRGFLIAAETGSGKTLSYLIPLINRLKREEEWSLKNPDHPNSIFKIHRPASPRALIIVPTSELSEQIHKILKALSKELKLTVCEFSPKLANNVIRKSILPKRIDVLVSTPSRLEKFFESGDLKSDMVRYLIVDEADTIFDQSFAESFTPLLQLVQQQLTYLVLCSATIPLALERNIRQRFHDMQRIVAPKIHSVPRRIDFSVVIETDKRQALLDILRKIQNSNSEPDADVKRAIVFCNTREAVREVYEYLKSIEEVTMSTQDEDRMFELIPFTRDNFDRHTALKRFNEPAIDAQSRKLRILLTTDMGSRGLDTITAKTVVLYDVPYSNIDLLHRLGRTARAGTRGRAFMIVSKAEYRGKTREWVNEIRDRLIRGEALV